ncbi:hypothetical protein AQ490_24205 [Wenjunlia vitaminophila]|uniref:Ornithine cyclodeaminase n=1 Tax=Wenjunlia vitaminophila TaxID=76728 RepID=A0A0T6LS42_WENVI|nr:hypothetical protein [Wenjunlia vitaminophila]KRV48642.1 hypothetical protein AQ490_24205 [Wenjunlia vitaminophila]
MTDEVLFLDRSGVRAAMAQVDPCATVERVLRHHARGRVTRSPGGSLSWTNGADGRCHARATLGAVEADTDPAVLGVTLASASSDDPARGRERAGGMGVLLDAGTARPRLLAETGWLGVARTAAYTAVSVRHLGPAQWDAVSLVGCGTVARAHLELLAREFPRAIRVHLHDQVDARARTLADWVSRHHPRMTPEVHDTPERAVRAAPVVLTTATAGHGYLPASWLRPGTFVAHVCPDALLPDAFPTAQGLFVDDVELVADDPHVLGRLLRNGEVAAGRTAGGAQGRRAGGPGAPRPLDGTLGQVLVGERPAIRPTVGHVISNPIGMTALDLGLLDELHRAATTHGHGRRLTLR